jgi:hypothetical protein
MWYKTFVPHFIELNTNNFSTTNNYFLILGKKSQTIAVGNSIVKYKKSIFTALPLIIYLSFNSKKIFFHGLLSTKLILIYNLFPFFLNKAFWIIWGGDLYYYTNGKNDFLYELKNYFRKRVIQRVKYNITYLEGDHHKAIKWYNSKAIYINCLVYPSNIISEEFSFITKEYSKKIKVLVGNSADPTNCHFEIFDLLAKIDCDDLEIFCPLSYGISNYRDDVINYGKKLFEKNFYPLTQFIELNEYKLFLNTIDVAIFGHHRQQAMGNTIYLLSKNIPVYIREGTSQFDLFKKLGITFYTINDLNNSFLSNSKNVNNRNIVLNYFSESNLISQWIEIYNLN